MAFFRFLDLPREVRDLVYVEFVKNIRMTFIRQSNKARSWAFRITDVDYSDQVAKFQRAPLLYACHQLRSEMLDFITMSVPLRVIEFTRLEDPVRTLRTIVPSEVRQRVRAIDLSLLVEYVSLTPVDPFTNSASVKQYPLEDAFPQLKQVTIKAPYYITPLVRLQRAGEDATDHAIIVRSQILKDYSAIKDLYDHFQGRALDFRLDLSCTLQSSQYGDFVSCWSCELQKPPENENDFVLRRKRMRHLPAFTRELY